jgi:hypothetical protein
MKRAAFAATVAGVLAASVSFAQAQQRSVNFYNWSNYMAPGVLEEFTKETGIKVTYDTFDANETVETRLLAGKSGYDVVVPTAYFLQRQIAANIFQKLDKSKIPILPTRGLRSPSGLRSTIRATCLRPITCGAPRASATTSRRFRKSSGRTQSSTRGRLCSSREPHEVQGLRHPDAGFCG